MCNLATSNLVKYIKQTKVNKPYQIIRVEHSDGYGMFISKINKRKRKHAIGCIPSLELLLHRHSKFNSCFEDFGDKFTKKHYCGYKTIKQIQKWITKNEFTELIKYQYKIYLLEVSECLIGKDQMAFQKKDIINKKDITQLFL